MNLNIEIAKLISNTTKLPGVGEFTTDEIIDIGRRLRAGETVRIGDLEFRIVDREE